MVSETVADQCMNSGNSQEALNRGLKLVLPRLSPGNLRNLRACKRLGSGVPTSPNWSEPKWHQGFLEVLDKVPETVGHRCI